MHVVFSRIRDKSVALLYFWSAKKLPVFLHCSWLSYVSRVDSGVCWFHVLLIESGVAVSSVGLCFFTLFISVSLEYELHLSSMWWARQRSNFNSCIFIWSLFATSYYCKSHCIPLYLIANDRITAQKKISIQTCLACLDWCIKPFRPNIGSMGINVCLKSDYDKSPDLFRMSRLAHNAFSAQQYLWWVCLLCVLVEFALIMRQNSICWEIEVVLI